MKLLLQFLLLPLLLLPFLLPWLLLRRLRLHRLPGLRPGRRGCRRPQVRRRRRHAGPRRHREIGLFALRRQRPLT
ncbi:MAG: hypothetical protein KGO01_20105, partial [Burkholderiales bacterium]|nr:hypothetical protein [Burkholderiales bacterium]